MDKKQKSERTRKISQIWVIAKDLNMNGENQDLLKMQIHLVTGKDSISALSIPELNMAISHLKILLARQRASRARNQPKLQMPTPSQREYVNDLVNQIDNAIHIRDREAYLNGIAQKSYGKAYKGLTRQQIQGVIEALKIIKRRVSSIVPPPDAS